MPTITRDELTQRIARLAKATHDHDVIDALGAMRNGDMESAFYSLDAASSGLADRQYDEAAKEAEWLREELDSHMEEEET